MNEISYHNIGCPYCNNYKYKIFAKGTKLKSFDYYKDFKDFEKMNYVRCTKCDLIFANPRIKYDDNTLNGLFPLHVERRKLQFKAEEDRLKKEQKITNILKLLNGIAGTFLDVGCGFGGAMKAANELKFRTIGTELFKGYIDYCNNMGFNVIAGSVDKLNFEDNSFDVVYLEDVLEHVKDPFFFIAEANRILRSNGILFIDTWAFISPGNVVDGFGRKWRSDLNLDLTAHLTIFPMGLLIKYLMKTGFKLEKMDPEDQINISRKSKPSKKSIRFYNFYFRKI